MKTIYTSSDLDIRVYDDFLNEDESKFLFHNVYKNAHFKHPHTKKDGTLRKQRNKVIYGEIPNYTINYLGKTIVTKVHKWEELPILEKLRNKINKKTGQHYDVCVVQYYNNGQVGIKPHRDKEMTSGTIIASISLGETRTMCFENKYTKQDIKLKNKSLCLIMPPTNDYWLHSIPIDSSTKPRMSLIFRKYTPE